MAEDAAEAAVGAGRIRLVADLPAPPGWPATRAWPPRLSQVPSMGRGAAGRSQIRDYAYAAALASRGRPGDLLEAYDLWISLASGWRERYRAPSLACAAIVLASLPPASARMIQTITVQRAIEGASRALREAMEPLWGPGATGRPRTARLTAWGPIYGDRAVLTLSPGGGPLEGLPDQPVEATWGGVAEYLQSWGYDPPGRCPVPDPVELCPSPDLTLVRAVAGPW